MFYTFALSSFTGFTWVLSIIFVLETVQLPQGITKITSAELSSDVVGLPDVCSQYLTAANCTYDLAASALSSQLITHTPYSVANVTFASPDGTRGMPYGILNDFARQAQDSKFGHERAEYCLPVLDSKQFTCDQDTSHTRVGYTDEAIVASGLPIYNITIDLGAINSSSFIRQDVQNATMTVAQSVSAPHDTILTTSGRYADVLSQLAYGTNTTSATDVLTMFCTLNTRSSWQWVSFTLINGIISAAATGAGCDDERHSRHTGFFNLWYAIQGATSTFGSIDGYSKLINADPLTLQVNRQHALAANMTLLESVLSQMYAIVHTSYTAAHLGANGTEIQKMVYPQSYRVSVSWTGVTVLAFMISVFILVATLGQAIRWITAIRTLKSGGERSSLELLRPLDLIAHAVGDAERLGELLGTKEARNKRLRGRSGEGLVPNVKETTSKENIEEGKRCMASPATSDVFDKEPKGAFEDLRKGGSRTW